MLKPIIKTIINNLGYEITKSKFKPSFDRIYYNLLGTTKSITIFDVGAHRGESIIRFLKLFPDASIHAFEPDKSNFDSLHQKFNSKKSIHLTNLGVGSSETVLDFYRYKKSDVSSFNEIDINSSWTKIRSKQSGTDPEHFLVGKAKVYVETLDNYITKNCIKQINILKMDTQGFEDECLKGAKNTLKEQMFQFIELELIIDGPYAKQNRFSDIENLLLPYGYKLIGIERGSDLYIKHILQFDLLFVNESVYKSLRSVKQKTN